MRRTGAIVLAIVLAAPAAAAAQTRLPDQSAETVAAARAQAESAARELEKARGQNPGKSTGLERAAGVSKSWRFTGADKPGNGNGKAFGQGRADAVHEALASGVSPSTLDRHGQAVSAAAKEMAAAFNAMKEKPADHPGQGKGVGGPGGDG